MEDDEASGKAANVGVIFLEDGDGNIGFFEF
jgi:hypothetical protein